MAVLVYIDRYVKMKNIDDELKSGSQRQKKNDEKCFLFHLKSLFRSQDI